MGGQGIVKHAHLRIIPPDRLHRTQTQGQLQETGYNYNRLYDSSCHHWSGTPPEDLLIDCYYKNIYKDDMIKNKFTNKEFAPIRKTLNSINSGKNYE